MSKKDFNDFPRDHGSHARENLDPNQSSLITRTSQLVELCHVTGFRRHLETKTEDVRTSTGRGYVDLESSSIFVSSVFIGLRILKIVLNNILEII